MKSCHFLFWQRIMYADYSWINRNYVFFKIMSCQNLNSALPEFKPINDKTKSHWIFKQFHANYMKYQLLGYDTFELALSRIMCHILTERNVITWHMLNILRFSREKSCNKYLYSLSFYFSKIIFSIQMSKYINFTLEQPSSHYYCLCHSCQRVMWWLLN